MFYFYLKKEKNLNTQYNPIFPTLPNLFPVSQDMTIGEAIKSCDDGIPITYHNNVVCGDTTYQD